MPANPKQKERSISLTPINEADQIRAVVDAIAKLNETRLDEFGAWAGLDALSTHTVFESIEPHPDGIFKVGKDSFEAVATVYVTLQYGGSNDSTAMSDSYPARIKGRFKGKNQIEIEAIAVDTTSFYE